MRVSARSLTRRFDDFVALDEVTFDIPSGSRVALVGPNGSGKSTLNRILMGLLRYEGQVEVDGVAPGSAAARHASRIGYVPQLAPGFAVPVRDLVRAIARLREVPESRVATLAARLDLDLEALSRRPFRGLSGGMKHKLLLALTLAGRNALLILDEPTSSLDAASREQFQPLLEECADGATVLLCSHRRDELHGRVDRVLELIDGRVAFDGPAADHRERRDRSGGLRVSA